MDHSFCSPLNEERAWAQAWQDGADRTALARLIAAHRPRLRSLARAISRHEAEDLLAEGELALLQAASRWRPVAGISFYAFAARAVRGAMLSAQARSASLLSCPERRLRDATAGRLGAGAEAEVRALLSTESFDERLCPQQSPAAEELALDRERHRLMRRALARALRPLARDERRLVLRRLRGSAEPDGGSLTPARARRIEGRALMKMRNSLLHDGFAPGDLSL